MNTNAFDGIGLIERSSAIDKVEVIDRDITETGWYTFYLCWF